MHNLCSIFNSQYGYIDGKKICINEYIENINSNKSKILCCNQHELVFANGSQRKPYFKHKNRNDVVENPMTMWHLEWQSHFPVTEKSFIRKEGQIKERRADVVLNENKILEIQHTKYERQEFDNRKKDYGLHNVDIIWLIHGENSIIVKELKNSNRVYLEFVSDYWKYEHFKSYDYIFIDIDSKIYKINPNKVKSHMIDVENHKTKEEFIESLKKNVDIWENKEPEQCNLFIKQQGAGNGKTYGIIKMLEDDDKCLYKNFIYITKQHSAKHIIKTEFENQQHNFKYLKNIEITNEQKKYIIKYFNEKSQNDCKIIISTIDSFTYSIGNKNHTYFDKFEGLIYSIIDGHIESKNCGTINFGGINPKLNKETLLVIDEFQDPPEDYAKAIIQIMRDKYIDVFIVGDKLQSISTDKNAFTYFLENEFPSINIIKLEPTNICRRFTHTNLVNFVNYMIPFGKYNLPLITPYKEYNDNTNNNPLVFFIGKRIDVENKNDKNEEVITEEVEKIMSHYEKEVDENNRFPEDFLIVTPFTKKNPLVDALLITINIYWKNKFTNNIEYMKKWQKDMDIEEYYRYAIFHKSEEGSSIDLSESEYSTRIVSCHAAKGDGRKIVFIIGFTESAIKRFSGTSNNLVYDSLFHVGITRMKEKLYIRYEDNNDDITEKINSYRFNNEVMNKEIKPNIDIRNKIKYSDIIDDNKTNNFNLFYEKIIKPSEIETSFENKDDKRIVDMGNHMIRYSSLFINLLLEIVNKENNNNKSSDIKIKKQINAILHKVCESDVTPVNNMKGYYKLLEAEKEIPILKISDKGRDYKNYFHSINDIIKSLQTKIEHLLNNRQIFLCPLECILLNYMIEIVDQKKYSNINIIDIYDIIDIYSSSFDVNDIGHDKCLCKEKFNITKEKINKNKKIDNMKLYILKHFEKIQDIKNIMSLFYEKYPQINWLLNHTLKFNGNDTFKVSKKFKVIGYDDNNVIICYIKPQFNSLNYNDILMDSIFDTYLMRNIKKYEIKQDGNQVVSENYKRFSNKKIVICVFTLDRKEPYYIDWFDIIQTNTEIITNSIYSSIMEKYLLENSRIFYFYSYWRKFCPDNENTSSSNFIRFLKDKIQEVKGQTQIPCYIDDFFSHIEFEIKKCKGKNNKELILNNYDDKEYFYVQLKQILDISVRRYLGMHIEEDDEE